MKSNRTRTRCITLTQRQLLARVRRQREAEQRHRGDQHARHDQIEEVVQRLAPDQDGERDVDVRLRAAVVVDLVPFARHAWRFTDGVDLEEDGWVVWGW